MSARLSAVADEQVACARDARPSASAPLRRPPLGRQLGALELGEIGLADEGQPEAQGRDVGLVIILLPEHPAQHVGAVEPVGGDQRRAVGEIEAGGVAFGQELSPTWSTGMRPLALTVGEELRASASRPSGCHIRAARSAGRAWPRSAGSCSNFPTGAYSCRIRLAVIASPPLHARPLTRRRPPRPTIKTSVGFHQPGLIRFRGVIPREREESQQLVSSPSRSAHRKDRSQPDLAAVDQYRVVSKLADAISLTAFVSRAMASSIALVIFLIVYRACAESA